MRIPLATYRFQFNSGFRFEQAQELLEYLSDLGISDIYASPIFAARQGSIHGYDVVDPTKINPEIGSEEDFTALIQEAGVRGLGWLQDIVPNHMAFDGQNKMLMDVFENGESSAYYGFFDIEWDHAYESMKGRMLAPFLGQPYGRCLEGGEIKVGYDEGGFSVNYYSLCFPLRIESYPRVLSLNLNTLKEALGSESPEFIKFIGVVYMLRAFPCQDIASERPDQIRFAKRMLWELYEGNEEIRAFIDGNLEELNSGGRSRDHNILHELLYQQFYRLSYWKVAGEEINYRRFFSINELLSLRINDPEVFSQTHSLILDLVSKGAFTGLRIDHIDGLYDPLRYLRKLQERTEGVYVTVEKILALDEDLPIDWPVQGTTGYDYMNYLNGLFCYQRNVEAMEKVYSDFLGRKIAYQDLIYEKKGVIVERYMTGDVDNLAHLMKRISSRDREGGDITLYGLREAIYETLGFFPIYRTYISPDSFTENDRRYISEAIARAKKRNPDLLNELSYLNKFLMLELEDYLNEKERTDWLHFVMRFQQFTGPLMAKGFEDTTLYVYNRLISLNEVGGEPSSFGVSVDKFHAFNSMRMERWPHAMSASSTHDAKRGEDVRARINVLSEMPEEWRSRVEAWGRINAEKKKRTAEREIPGKNDEYFLYQTLLGAFPFNAAEQGEELTLRIKDYIIKAIREAKVHTGWIRTDEEYEEGFLAFLDDVLEPSEHNAFLEDFIPFQRKIAHYGIINSLSQTLTKITSPGAPDFYQGSELWELSLVDPDNRRPVDYGYRMKFLREIKKDGLDEGYAQSLLTTPEDGKIKLFLIYKGLKARREHASLFQEGIYIPLETEGELKEHIVAFARKLDNQWALTIVPRFSTFIVDEGEYPFGEKIWKDTCVILPAGAPSRWIDAITGRRITGDRKIAIGAALKSFPAGLLLGEENA